MPTPPMPSTAGHPFILCRLPSATPPSPPPAATSMLAPKTAPEDFSRSDSGKRQVPSHLCGTGVPNRRRPRADTDFLTCGLLTAPTTSYLVDAAFLAIEILHKRNIWLTDLRRPADLAIFCWMRSQAAPVVGCQTGGD